MVLATLERRLRALGVTPIRALDLAPPRRLRRGPRGGKVIGQETCEHERPAEALGCGRVAGGPDKCRELLVRDGHRIDPEALDVDLAHRSFAIGREAVW